MDKTAKKRKKGKKRGRRTVMTKKVLDNLKEAFLLDCTDEEACAKAGIGTTTLYRYLKQNPEFRDKIQAWKQNMFLIARKSMARDIETDGKLALAYMERKKKDEFSPRQELTGADGRAIEVATDKIETDYANVAREIREQIMENKPPLQDNGQEGATPDIHTQSDSANASGGEAEPSSQPNPQS